MYIRNFLCESSFVYSFVGIRSFYFFLALFLLLLLLPLPLRSCSTSRIYLHDSYCSLCALCASSNTNKQFIESRCAGIRLFLKEFTQHTAHNVFRWCVYGVFEATRRIAENFIHNVTVKYNIKHSIDVLFKIKCSPNAHIYSN